MLTQFLTLLGLSQLEIDAIRLSLEVSVSAMIWSLPFAIFVAWLLARKEFYGKSIVSGIIHLPLVLPPVVIGYLLLVAMVRADFRLQLARGGISRCRGGISISGSGNSSFAGKYRLKIGTSRQNLGRFPLAGIFYHHLAPIFAGNFSGHRIGICPLLG